MELGVYGTPDGVKTYDIATVKAGSKVEVSTSGTVTGPGMSPLTLTNGTSQLVNAAIPVGAGPHIYTVTFGTLRKTIKVTVQAPLDGFSTALPFTEVASITTEGGSDWLTLSHNETYVKDEQQSGFIEGDAQGKAYMHLTENLSSKGATRTAKAMVTHNNSRGTTRVMLEQRKNEIVGYFGGDPASTMTGEGTMYPKQLVVASADISDKQYKTAATENASSIVNSIYYGRDMNIAAAKLGSTELANYPAFEYCAGLNKDLDGNGTIDDSERIWYLPSQNQLMAMWVFNGGLDIPFTDIYYWSATQYSATDVFYMSFYDGTMTNVNKTKTPHYYVRCVRDL